MSQKPDDGGPETTTTPIELLKRSCSRLPRFIELNAPACAIANEIRILTGLAMTALCDAIVAEGKAKRNKEGETDVH